MGWSCLKSQSDIMDKVMQWQSSQPEYAKNKGNFIFFELAEKDDYDDKNPLRLEIIEVVNGEGYRRGELVIKGNGEVINRSYIKLPEFNN